MSSCDFWQDLGTRWVPCTNAPLEGSRFCHVHHYERQWASEAVERAKAIEGPARAAQMRAAAENWVRLCRRPPPSPAVTQQRADAVALARGTVERQVAAKAAEAQRIRRELEDDQREQQRRAAERTLARIERTPLPARFVPPPPTAEMRAARRAAEAKRQDLEARQRDAEERRRVAERRRRDKAAAAEADRRRRADARAARATGRGRQAARLHLTDEDCWAQRTTRWAVSVTHDDAEYREATQLFRAGAVTRRAHGWVSPRWDRWKEGKP